MAKFIKTCEYCKGKYDPLLETCPKCGEAIKPHRACTKCGTYKGKEVIKVDNNEE